MPQESVSPVECPDCTYRFEAPEATFELNDGFECPQCGMDFMVTSTEPLEFGPWQHPETVAPIKEFWLAMDDLVHPGEKVHLPNHSYLTVLTDKAFRQGLQEITLRVTLPSWPSKEAIVEVLQAD